MEKAWAGKTQTRELICGVHQAVTPQTVRKQNRANTKTSSDTWNLQSVLPQCYWTTQSHMHMNFYWCSLHTIKSSILNALVQGQDLCEIVQMSLSWSADHRLSIQIPDRGVPPRPQPLAITKLLSVSGDLPGVNILSKWPYSCILFPVWLFTLCIIFSEFTTLWNILAFSLW